MKSLQISTGFELVFAEPNPTFSEVRQRFGRQKWLNHRVCRTCRTFWAICLRACACARTARARARRDRSLWAPEVRQNASESLCEAKIRSAEPLPNLFKACSANGYTVGFSALCRTCRTSAEPLEVRRTFVRFWVLGETLSSATARSECSPPCTNERRAGHGWSFLRPSYGTRLRNWKGGCLRRRECPRCR